MTTTTSTNMDDLLSKMKLEVDQLQNAIPCLSVGKETEKLMLESSSHSTPSLLNGILPSLSLPPPPPPSECSTNMIASSPTSNISPLSPTLSSTLKRKVMLLFWSSSRGKKGTILLILWIILGLTYLFFPPSFLFTFKTNSKSVSTHPPQTTRIDKEFNYVRWFLYTSFITGLFWGFHQISV